ncbi:hypothetical protein AUJ66_03410 [Candidatus Desantisbacteria bacterium CG1_02_38_46]|uniref:PIN domain-containing protein n=3 Tax=unclassified Candidatus Desantisiibacteriota TaxID=3106372 RepID=A0A2H9PCA2_9BACT|nr:MAG: hypothetical protein AUJ66_03410 [Candidatus Desantisbacteria bacterium CG1_02_38_46]PIU50867.1 MAG: PIN domain-containing protein [Candidatus Desantisbacteria bacterium CG07_land_8_20_14_0_80_39_15]PIZ16780.1 MAG: PIN domain-containing protein [Candidatus Desantisbacteria bacterium CG_4_10_14_0_8_um_filter_39_17]
MSKAFLDTNIILRLLIKDDEVKIKSCLELIKNANEREASLYLLPVTILEIVWVLEKVYKYSRQNIVELVGAILNTPGIKTESEEVFRKALSDYETKGIKFADAVMGHWGMEKGFTTVYTYDEKDFKKIEGLEVKKP